MASQTIDGTIAELLSMGFEFQDAQDAIQYGKVTVQDAIDWILAGKPGYTDGRAAPPTLRLNNQNPTLPSLQPDRAAPFVSPVPLSTSSTSANEGASAQPPTSPSSAAVATAAAIATSSSSDIDMEQQVVSRLHLSDTKLAQRKQFEEKVRADVEKKARMEKLQAKREHERVLKEIAEDRKVSKMLKTGNGAKAADKPADVPKTTQKPTCSTSGAGNTATHCSIQIRLPSGKQLRKKLESSTTLGRLWLTVLEEAEAETEGYSGFMQPFPRQEFSASDMNKTLQQLGLAPSGSLVLKKMETVEAEPEKEAEAVQESPPEADPMEERELPIGAWVSVDRYRWGRGRTLDGQEPAEEGTEAEAVQESPPEAEPVEERELPIGAWMSVDRYRWGRGRTLDGQEPAEEEIVQMEFVEMGEEEDTEEYWDNDIPPRHWGRGRRLEDEEEENQNGEEENVDDDDNNDDDAQMGGWVGGAGQRGANPLLQGFLGQQFGLGAGLAHGAFEGVGQRLVPEGVPGADDHVNRRMGDLAAEAAQQRLAQPAPVVVSEVRQAVTVVRIPRLYELAMAMIIDRITCNARPLHTLGRLPELISEIILQRLVQRNLLDSKTLRLFCSCCLQKLVLDTYTYATNDLLNAVRLHPHLQVLSLQSCPLISDRGIEFIAGLKKLKVLNLGLCKQMTDKCLQVIAGFRQLQMLSLEDTGVTDSGVIKYMATRPCLRFLNLNRTAVTDAIFQHLKNLEHLETLHLEDTKVTSLEGIRDLPKLTGLNLASTAIPTSTLSHLQHHPTLVNLSLSNTENVAGDQAFLYLTGLKLRSFCLPSRHTVTGAGLVNIASFPLQTLDLTNYIHVGDEGMEFVGQITSLEKLMLTNTKVTDAGLQLLSGLTRLQILHLDRTSVSDVGITIVRAFRELSELSLSTTNVTNNFLKKGVLHSCQGLTKLNLSRTHVGDRGAERLTLPHLALLNLDCTGVHPWVVDTIKANCPALKSVTTANLTPVLEEEEEED